MKRRAFSPKTTSLVGDDVRSRRNAVLGFSLIELLAVLAVLGIVAALTIPSMSSVLRGSALAAAEDELAAELGLARQQAVAGNRDVEVRFYRYTDSAAAGTLQDRFQSFQLVAYDESGKAIPSSRIKKISPRVVLASDEKLSTLLGASLKKTWGTETKPSLPTIGTNYEAYAIRFRPDGSADLTPFPTVPWFLTLHDSAAGDGLKTPPANYATLVIDAVNGHVSRFRP